jgi:hypothetical protein
MPAAVAGTFLVQPAAFVVRMRLGPHGSGIERILQNFPDAFIHGASSLEPGRICMITSYSQIASSRPKPMLDACVAL